MNVIFRTSLAAATYTWTDQKAQANTLCKFEIIKEIGNHFIAFFVIRTIRANHFCPGNAVLCKANVLLDPFPIISRDFNGALLRIRSMPS